MGVDRDPHTSSTVCAAQPISGTATRHDLITRDKNLGEVEILEGQQHDWTSSWRAVSLAALICAETKPKEPERASTRLEEVRG